MTRGARLRNSDLRGAARLATDATVGLADLVEALHARIARGPGRAPATPGGRTGGIPGLVYRTIRGVTRVVGGSVDSLLGLLTPALGRDHPVPEREAILAALNGVLGDYLAATANPLATTMALRRDGRVLLADTGALATSGLPDASGRLLLMVHGLCMNDLQWSRDGHDHGAALARDLGFTPLYLHYNSGLHVSINGHALARQLERLVEQWPRPVERLAVVGHSMGGLLARSAAHYGKQAGHRWPSLLTDMVFLGTPHHGAPLERAGNWLQLLLASAHYSAPFARLGRLRSAGITDLRHGNLIDEDWVGRDRFARSADFRQHLPLPPHVHCCTIAASLSRPGGEPNRLLLGDGLVPVNSALGRHRDPARRLAFPDDRQWLGYRMNHLDLLQHPGIYPRLLHWLGRANPA